MLIVFAGDGKGKTTAALGLALRALGHVVRVLMVQFIKGDMPTGELAAAEKYGETFRIVRYGRGFVGPEGSPPSREDVEAARNGLAFAREAVAGKRFGVVILDEVCNAVRLGLIDEQALLELVQNRDPGVHVVLTGRGASAAVIEAADLVTEMRCVKHPYDRGIKAQKGIEY